jgi:hypothetical protein
MRLRPGKPSLGNLKGMLRLDSLPSALASRRFLPRVSRSRFLHIALKGLAGLFAIVMIVVGVVIAVVLSGPTELGVVRSRIAAILSNNLGEDYDVSVGRAVIDVDPVYGLVLQVDDVTIRDNQRAVVANVPSTRLDIDPSGLFGFRIDIHAVELNNAELAFVRADTGEVYLGNSATAHAAARKRKQPPANALPERDAAGGFPDLLAAMQILDRGIEPAINSAIKEGLQRFSFNNGTIEVWDAERAQERRFPRSDLTITVDPLTTALSATFATSGFGGRWTAEVERDVDASSGARTMSAVFNQLTLADILPKLGDSDGPVTADIPLYGRASIRYNNAGDVEDASVRLDVGAGVFNFAEGRESVLLDEATVKLRWNVADEAVIIEPSTFFFGETRGVVVGKITPEGDPAAGHYRFDLESRGAILAPGDSNEAPLIAQRIGISGMADLPGRMIVLDNATIETPQGSVTAAGSIGLEAKTPSVVLAAQFSEMPVATIKQIWIPFIAPGARRWVLQHVTEGRIKEGRFDAAIPGGLLWTGKRPQMPEDMMRLNFRLEDVSFTTIGDLPPVENANGVAVLAGTTFGVDLESGIVKVKSGPPVTIEAGAFAIANTAQRHPEGVIEMQLSGDAASLGEIADAKPLLALQRQNVLPSDLSGTATAAVSIRLPLRPDLTEGDVDWRVSIDGTDLASKAPIVGRTITDGNMNIVVTPAEVVVRGTAKLDGVAADLDMSQPLAPGGGVSGSGQQMVRLTLDDAARKRLGIGLDEILAGSVGTFVSNVEGGKGQHYDLDLKQARLVLPGLGWSKGIGVPASLSFDLLPKDGGGYSVAGLKLEGADFGFSGTAELDKDYALVSAEISHMSLRPGDSMAFKLNRNKTGYAISARGKSFDMRGFLTNLRDQQGSSGGSPDLDVEARFDRLVGFAKEEIRNASIAVVTSSGSMRKLSFSGALGDTDIAASYSDTGEGASLSVSSPDGGRLLRFANFYSKINAGNLTIRASRPGASGPLVGTLSLTNFEIVGEQAMTKVVSTGATAGQGGGRTGFDPGRVRFDRMVVNFGKTDQAIVISDALLRGAAVGATFNGRFDLNSSRVSINGTYLPAYQLNNFFGRLPIIGLALGGGQEGGLIGVTFKVEGTTDEPRLFINPLSAIAPGIFRKIFEFQ